MSESTLRERSTDFAVEIIKLCETITGLYNQCGTIRRVLIASINTAKKNMK